MSELFCFQNRSFGLFYDNKSYDSSLTREYLEMRLQTKLYIFSTFAIIAGLLAVVLSGTIIINQIVYDLNRKILSLEVENVLIKINDMYKVLEESGLSKSEQYRQAVNKELFEKMNSYRLGRTGRLFLIDTKSKMDFKPAEIPLDEGVLRSTILINAAGDLEFKDRNTGKSAFGVYKTSKSGWKIFVYMDRTEMFEKRDAYFRIVCAIGLLILVLGLTFSYYLADKLSYQISEILEIVRRVAKGDMNARIDMMPFSEEHKGLQVGINSMIEELKNRERERELAEEESRKHQKLESIGILAGGIAHDFNNLLTAIRGNIQLAAMSQTLDEIKLCLGDCEKATVKTMDLTRQLLTFAKGGSPLKETTSIKEIIEHSAGFMLRGSKSKCEIEIAEDIKPVDVDAAQISQAIDNIVINANQAMPSGGIIRIRAENIAITGKSPLPLAEGEYIKISIADQGEGISKANLEKIFDPFFTTKKTGSGLGLPTAYSVVKKHGGHITVDSEPGMGSIFFIYIPVSNAPVKAQEKQADAPLIPQDVKGRVLIMDDQESIRILLGRMMNSMNCRSDFAENGVEAIEKYKTAMLEKDPFDVVFMDLTIPGSMGGRETIVELQKIDPSVTAVVASGYSNDPVMADFRKYGFSARLNKPFKLQDLMFIMVEILNRKKNKKS